LKTMKIEKIIKELSCDVLADGGEQEVADGYTSDLLSDVMGNCPEGSLWITIQRHMNVIAVAQLKRIVCILLTNGVTPDTMVLEKAKEEGITILSTTDNAFTATGKVYRLLHAQTAATN